MGVHVLIEAYFPLEIVNFMYSNHGRILSVIALYSNICSIPSFPPFGSGGMGISNHGALDPLE